MSVEAPRKTLHSKRSFGKYPKIVDSPAYDASEEDNDPLTDDGASGVSVPISIPRHATATGSRSAHLKPSATTRAKHQLASSLLSDSDGVDSPTYDGDIESSTTAGAEPINSTRSLHYHHTNSTTISTLPTSSATTTPAAEVPNPMRTTHPVFISQPVNVAATPLNVTEEPAVPAPCEAAFNPAALTPEDIRAFVEKAIDGESWRDYKINQPPVGRPIRIYADGVYDLFHFGHALQLRQAKLSFPSVYLLVGVNSDELVKDHKARSIMTHAERLEAARHCRWVDEVIAEAPWVIDEAFLDKWEIDYVAHDEVPYAADGHEDVYALVKSQGKFLPTRRTPGVSTSDLLERIVSGYRNRDFDQKLIKIGHAELKAEGSDYDNHSLNSSRFASRSISPVQGVTVVAPTPMAL
ncbi:cholinephosphate cytidylyltransferase [Infundibulicybe gibba]|nr:cholinephosphate cytidylyltransferase [Infundibulicybe gibba]